MHQLSLLSHTLADGPASALGGGIEADQNRFDVDDQASDDVKSSTTMSIYILQLK